MVLISPATDFIILHVNTEARILLYLKLFFDRGLVSEKTN